MMTEKQFLQKLNVKGYEEYKQRAILKWDNKNYRIMPDEAFYFDNKIIIVEFENNKRLVESISKFWWLFKATDWCKLEIETELHFVILESHGSEIRELSVQILGEELARQEKYFKFHFYKVT